MISRLQIWLAAVGAAVLAVLTFGYSQRRAGRQDTKDEANADTIKRTAKGRDAVRDGRDRSPDDSLRHNDGQW